MPARPQASAGEQNAFIGPGVCSSLSLAGAVALLVAVGVGCQPSPKTVTVWHAEEGADLALRSVAQQHEDSTGTRVEVRSFGDRSTLRDSLQAGRSTPDVFIGPHLWGDRLRERGVANAYCRPGQCEACRGDNPPEWCKYALGDFSHGRIKSMAVGTALCTEDQCPACFGEAPPEICKVMSLAREGALDVARQPDLLQASFAGVYSGEVFPWGIPIWWEFPVVGINPDRVDATAIGDVLSRVREEPGMVYTDPVLDGDPVPFPADVRGDTSLSEAGVFVTVPSRVPALQDQVSQFAVATPAASAYRPPILVTGGYVHAGTDVKEAALNFMYRVADEAAQERFHESTGHLPAHGEVLGQVSEGALQQGVVRQGVAGIPLLQRPQR